MMGNEISETVFVCVTLIILIIFSFWGKANTTYLSPKVTRLVNFLSTECGRGVLPDGIAHAATLTTRTKVRRICMLKRYL